MKNFSTLLLGALVLSMTPALTAQTTSSTTTTTTNGQVPNTTTPTTAAPYFGPASYPTNPGTPGQADDMEQVFKDNNK